MTAIREIDSGQLSALMEAADQPLRLVDIRTAAEVAQGVIPGSEFVPMHLIPLRSADWGDDELIVFYCRSGARSAQVCRFLQQQGRDNVVNLRGGIIDWYRRGLPVVAPQDAGVAV